MINIGDKGEGPYGRGNANLKMIEQTAVKAYVVAVGGFEVDT